MLRVLYEDDDLIALAKPAGLSTQAPPIAGPCLETLVRAHLAGSAGRTAYLGCVHRLDRPVSGIVVWAKHVRAARILSRQFERRDVHKTYWAIVEGIPRDSDGVWEDWLVREDTGLGRVQTCRAGTPRAQRARTRFALETAWKAPQERSHLVLIPETGRMHQLRVQCAARGLPIVGDARYGARSEFGPDEIALHARAIGFRHPGDGRPRTLVAPLPEGWGVFGLSG